MVTNAGAGLRARRARRTRTLALLALVVGAVAIWAVVLSKGGGYRLHLRMESASQLVKGDLVEVGGLPVGKVRDIELTDRNQADVTVSIDDSRLTPLHAGTRAYVRVPSLSGVANRYIALAPGPNSNAALRTGAIVPASDTQSAVDLDSVLATLDAATRANLQTVVHGLAASLTGGGSQALNRTLAYLDPAVGQTGATLRELVADRPALTRFIAASSNVVSAVAARRGDLEQGLASAATTAGALASQAGALRTALAEAPPVIGHATRTLGTLTAALDALTPTAAAALPVAPRLSRVLASADPTLRRGAAVLPRVRALLGPLADVLDGLPALSRTTIPALNATTKAGDGLLPILEQGLPYIP
ncbi:MAG TPA: MlaD family protein, partial [Solirubrobacteraceae bacterium]|nr:MlaD family protein [Solirubrobacteraceae bacterium]